MADRWLSIFRPPAQSAASEVIVRDAQAYCAELPTAARAVWLQALTAARTAMVAALAERPTTAQLLESALVHAWNVVEHLDRDNWRVTAWAGVLFRDVERVALDLGQDARVRAWIAEGAIDDFLLHHLMLFVGRADVALRFPVLLRQWLPDQHVIVRGEEADQGWRFGVLGGPPAERNKLLPAVDVLNAEAGAPQNTKGRPAGTYVLTLAEFVRVASKTYRDLRAEMLPAGDVQIAAAIGVSQATFSRRKKEALDEGLLAGWPPGE